MGYQFREVGEKKGRHYFLICDACGLAVDVVNSYGASRYEEDNRWHKVFNDIYSSFNKSERVKEFCNSCAQALGYINEKGEKLNECQENGIIESTEAVPAGN